MINFNLVLIFQNVLALYNFFSIQLKKVLQLLDPKKNHDNIFSVIKNTN